MEIDEELELPEGRVKDAVLRDINKSTRFRPVRIIATVLTLIGAINVYDSGLVSTEESLVLPVLFTLICGSVLIWTLKRPARAKLLSAQPLLWKTFDEVRAFKPTDLREEVAQFEREIADGQSTTVGPVTVAPTALFIDPQLYMTMSSVFWVYVQPDDKFPNYLTPEKTAAFVTGHTSLGAFTGDPVLIIRFQASLRGDAMLLRLSRRAIARLLKALSDANPKLVVGWDEALEEPLGEFPHELHDIATEEGIIARYETALQTLAD